jgi:MFS family permease
VSALAPFRYPPFRFLIAGRAINSLGGTFGTVALAFAVLDITGSATDLGLVVATRTIFNVVFLLFGGVLADRLPKHLLMVGSNLLAAACQVTAAVLVLSHVATVPLLMVLAAINGTAAALSMPASSAVLPRIVPAEERQQANAVNRLTQNFAQVIGAPLAGVVVAAVGSGWGLAVDGASFALSAAAYALMRVPKETGPSHQERPHLFADLRTGWSEFRSRTWLWVVVAGFCFYNAAWSGGLFVLGPAIADESFGRRGWGFLLAAQTVGMILGGLLALRLRLRRLLYFGVASCFFLAPPLLVLGTYPRLWLLIPLAAIGGLMLEQFGVAWETSMQEHVPPDKLARVYSYDMVGSFVAMPIGEVLVGPISHAAGLETTEIGLGLLMTLAVVGMLSSRSVRTLPHKLAEPVVEPMGESVL